MRKLFSIFAGALIALGFAACSGSNEPENIDPKDSMFNIQFSDITTTSANMVITPSNMTLGYIFTTYTMDPEHIQTESDAILVFKAYLADAKYSGGTYQMLIERNKLNKGIYKGSVLWDGDPELDPNQKFAVVAMYINEELEVVGTPVCKSFTTLSDTPEPATEGAIKGIFSVSSSKKVYFSKGNLRAIYNDGWTWSFAANQWDYVGNTGGNVAISGGVSLGYVDLFGWSTPATNYGINSSTDILTYAGDFKDWGNNPIINGGNQANLWRTLSADEWAYLIHRDNDRKFGFGRVNDVAGLILLPDNWQMPAEVNKVFHASVKNGLYWNSASEYFENEDENNYDHNTFKGSEWNAMEQAGAVFLPAAGARYDKNVDQSGWYGLYWSSTPFEEQGATYLLFGPVDLYPKFDYYDARVHGNSVRLVTDVK